MLTPYGTESNCPGLDGMWSEVGTYVVLLLVDAASSTGHPVQAGCLIMSLLHSWRAGPARSNPCEHLGTDIVKAMVEDRGPEALPLHVQPA